MLNSLITRPISAFDDFFDFPSFPSFQLAQRKDFMKTDITETDTGYRLDIELPGLNKDEMSLDLKDGALTVSISKKEEKEDKNGKYLRRERFYGAASRSFSVDKELSIDDIKAKYENGVLSVSIAKKPEIKEEEKRILIE